MRVMSDSVSCEFDGALGDPSVLGGVRGGLDVGLFLKCGMRWNWMFAFVNSLTIQLNLYIRE